MVIDRTSRLAIGIAAVAAAIGVVLLARAERPTSNEATGASTSTTARIERSGGLDRSTVVLGLERLLEEFDQPAGSSLLVGGEGSALQRIDLDTGRVVVYEHRGSPLAVGGGRLLLQVSGTTTWRSIDLDRNEAPSIELDVDSGIHLPAFVEPDGSLWVVPYDGSSAALRRIDLETGRTVESIDLVGVGASLLAPQAMGEPMATPDLVNGRTGGLHRWTADGFEWVAPGRLLTTGQNLALVEECDEALRCRRRWIDTGTLETVDHPLPEVERPWLSIVGDDGWLVATGPPDWATQIIDISTGRPIDLETDGYQARLTFSADGRFAAWPTFRGVEIMELASGHHGVVPAVDLGLESRPIPSVLFVDNEAFDR